MKQTSSLGHDIEENGIKANEEKVEVVLKLNPPENTKEIKSFLGAIQYFWKARTDSGKYLKNEKWNWGSELEEYFKKIKQMLTENPCLPHYAKDKGHIVTIDASPTELGITLWQKQDYGNTKSIMYGSRYLNDIEKKYSIGELELLAVVWPLAKFQCYLYGKKVDL